MPWYIQIPLYLIGIIIAFIGLWQVDFNKFMRRGREQYAIVLYIILSIALGGMIGWVFVTLGGIFNS